MNRNEFGIRCGELREAGTLAQNDDELWWLFQKVLGRNPTRILEIGYERGGTLSFWSHLLSDVEGSKLVTVDDLCREIPGLADFECPPVIIHGDSHSAEIIAQAAAHGPYDFIFIDGDHSYEGVTADYKNYSTMVSPGGLIGFHDIEIVEGVKKFWSRLQGNKEEIRELFGIGVINK